jgi:hypothetical protein
MEEGDKSDPGEEMQVERRKHKHKHDAGRYRQQIRIEDEFSLGHQLWLGTASAMLELIWEPP